MKAENNGEINVFLCQDNTPENSPNLGQASQRRGAVADSNDTLIDDINRQLGKRKGIA